MGRLDAVFVKFMTLFVVLQYVRMSVRLSEGNSNASKFNENLIHFIMHV